MMKFKFAYSFRSLLLCCLLVHSVFLLAQIKEDFDIDHHIYLDTSLIIRSSRMLNSHDLIHLCLTDSTLITAFRQLHSHEWSQILDFDMRDVYRENQIYHAEVNQTIQSPRRVIQLISTQYTDRFFKKKKPRYYTFELFTKLFPLRGNYPMPPFQNKGKYTHLNKTNKRMNQLKQLVFNPGHKSNIPFLGNKMEIFSNKMAQYYNYIISYVDSTTHPYYLLAISVKPEFIMHENKTIIKYFETRFEPSSFQIIGRNYRLKARTPVFSFDVTIKMDLERSDALYYPKRLIYDGQWNVAFKKMEHGKFVTTFNLLPQK